MLAQGDGGTGPLVLAITHGDGGTGPDVFARAGLALTVKLRMDIAAISTNSTSAMVFTHLFM